MSPTTAHTAQGAQGARTGHSAPHRRQPPAWHLAWWAKHHFTAMRVGCFGLCLLPALALLLAWLGDALGAHPLERLLTVTGQAAGTLLLVTLAVTPLRRLSVAVSRHVHARYGKRLSDWNWLVRLRRQLGLFSFSYAASHAALYTWLDAGLDPAALAEDLREHRFMAFGVAALALMLPLALTSTRAAMRALGRRWGQLHRLTYAVALLALVHLWLQVKAGQAIAWPLTAGVLAVLVLRGLARVVGAPAPDDETQRQGAGHRRPH